jgi:hypothetical protein
MGQQIFVMLYDLLTHTPYRSVRIHEIIFLIYTEKVRMVG